MGIEQRVHPWLQSGMRNRIVFSQAIMAMHGENFCQWRGLPLRFASGAHVRACWTEAKLFCLATA